MALQISDIGAPALSPSRPGARYNHGLPAPEPSGAAHEEFPDMTRTAFRPSLSGPSTGRRHWLRQAAGAATALVALASLMTAPAALAQPAAPATLRVGVEGNYPPFSRMGPDGRLTGFDIDIARALCTEMKVQCTLVQQEWDGMMPALNARKFDMIVASMTITEERKKAAAFSDPYYSVPSRFVGKAGAFKDHSPAALKGKKIIVLRNSPRAQYVAANYKDSDVLLVTKETDVYLELLAGRGDIGFGSSVVSADALLKRPEGKAFAQVGPSINLDGGGGVGIAFRKNDDALRERVNAALKAIRANGTYQKLAAQYFDFDVSPN
jgi:polar amino acid transport system substrate-binding protein/arginine/ornithine transport system substrate-binding protein